MAIFLIGFWLSLKRTNRNYYVPPNYEGWVSIKYNYPDAPPLLQDSKGYHIYIPDSGYLVTSTPLEKGWGKDQFFRQKADSVQPIPNYVRSSEETKMYIHGRDIRKFSHEAILKQLPVGTDTTMWDGTQIKRKSENEISYQPGDNSLEYFYIFTTPQPLDIHLPQNPQREALESMKDHAIPTTQ